MQTTASEPMPMSPLVWGDAVLDGIFTKLPDFACLVLEVASQRRATEIWQLTCETTLSNARAAGLAVGLARWSGRALEPIGPEDPASQDLVFVDARTCDSASFSALCNQLGAWTSAVIVLAATVNDKWRLHFEMCVTLDSEKATWASADGKVRGEAELRSLQSPLERPAATPTPRVTVTLLGLDAETERRVRELIASVADVAPEDAAQHAAVVFTAAPGSHGFTKITAKASSKTRLLHVGGASLRESDRIAAYRAGASVLLPTQASPVEIAAALITNVTAKPEVSDETAALDVEFTELTRRHRQGLVVQKGDAAQLAANFHAIVANRFRRAAAAGTTPGALLFTLPSVPKVAGSTGDDAALARIILSGLAASVRSHDLAFVAGRTMVVVTPNLSRVTEHAVHGRIATTLRDAGFDGPRLVRLVPERTSSDCDGDASRFIVHLAEALAAV